MALEWIATGPHFTSISCTVRCRNGGEPPRNQRLLHRVSGHTRVDDLTSGEWTIRTPQRWWSGGRRPNEVLTGQETSHRFHVEIEFIIQPTEFIHWVSPVSATGQTTIGGRSGISLGAHWIGLNDVGQPMGMVVEESGLVLTAHVPSSPPYPDPWMDFSVDDVVIDPNLDDALFRWAGDPRVTPQDVDAEALKAAREIAALPPGAVALSRGLMRGATDELLARIDQEAKIFSECLHSPEAKAAFEAFFARKR